MKQICGFILIVVLVFLCGCNANKNSDIKELTTLSVNSESVNKETIRMSEIAKSATCVSLETNNDLLINDIVKVIHDNGAIYVADRMSLYKFDKDGQLLNKINNPGQGPGEYTNITDFVLGADDTIWILCRSSKQLVNYTWDSTVNDIIKLNYWVGNIYQMDTDRLCLYIGNEIEGDNQHQIKVLNLKTKKIEGGYLDIDSKKAKYLHVKSVNHFSTSPMDGAVYFFEMFNDTIYKLSDHQAIPTYYFSIDNKNIPASFFDTEYKDVMDFFQTLFKNTYAYGTNVFLTYASHNLFSYYYKGECHMTIIPKDSKLPSLDFKTIEEDVNLSGYPIKLTDLKLFVQNNNELVIALIPDDIATYVEETFGKEKAAEVRKKMKYTDEDQNPILIFMQM